MLEIKKATSQKDFFMCMEVHGLVFNYEQHVPSRIQIDQIDQTCLHYLAIEDQKPLATCRAIVEKNATHLGRVCVLKEYRKSGIGKKLLNYVLNDIKGEFYLDSQVHAIPFYKSLGFEAYGPIFQEADIDHQKMKIKI